MHLECYAYSPVRFTPPSLEVLVQSRFGNVIDEYDSMSSTWWPLHREAVCQAWVIADSQRRLSTDATSPRTHLRADPISVV